MNVHEKYMKIALQEARQALDAGEFPVGCVIVANDTVVATGGRLNSREEFRELDHAEIVALRNLQRNHPGIDLSTVTLYSTMEPCLMCFSTLLVNNVHRVVYGFEDVMGGGTNLPMHLLAPLYASMRIEVTKNVLREECLDLFQQFFLSAHNDYLQDTMLAKYTLEQP